MLAISGSRGDKRRHRTRFRHPLFKDLTVHGFPVIHQVVRINGLVKLTLVAVNAEVAEHAFHAERAGFIRDDGHNKLSDVPVPAQFCEQPHKPHGCGNILALTSRQKLPVLVECRNNRLGAVGRATGDVASQCLPPLVQIADFDALLRRFVERSISHVLVGNRKIPAVSQCAERLFVKFLLLMRDVAAFAGLAQTVAFDRLCENDAGFALAPNSRLVSGVNFFTIVAAPQNPHTVAIRVLAEQLD